MRIGFSIIMTCASPPTIPITPYQHLSLLVKKWFIPATRTIPPPNQNSIHICTCLDFAITAIAVSIIIAIMKAVRAHTLIMALPATVGLVLVLGLLHPIIFHHHRAQVWTSNSIAPNLAKMVKRKGYYPARRMILSR